MYLQKFSRKILREIIRLFPFSEETQCYIMGFADESYKAKYNILTKKFSVEEIDSLMESQRFYPQNILSCEDTIKEIVNNRKSISRLGDGEEFAAHILCDTPYIPALKERLIEIMENGSDENCLVCINNFNVFDKKVPSYYRRHFGIYWMIHSVKKLRETVNFNDASSYGDAYAILFYFNNNDEKEVRKRKLDEVKSIWQDKKILFVVSENSKILKDEKYFSNAAEKDFIIGPSSWAFREYDTLFKKITENYDNDWIVYLELGSCATVLSYDLSKLGYVALDMGDYYARTVLAKERRGLI